MVYCLVRPLCRWAVQELLGHKTLAMVMRYAHLTPEYQSERLSAWLTASRKQMWVLNLGRPLVDFTSGA